MPSTTADVKKAKAFWEQLKERARMHEKVTGKRPWFRMSTKTLRLITHNAVLGASPVATEVEYQGYRLIYDDSLKPGQILAEDGIMTI